MNGRGKAGQRELMPAPHGLRKQRRDTVVDVECGVRQMLTLKSWGFHCLPLPCFQLRAIRCWNGVWCRCCVCFYYWRNLGIINDRWHSTGTWLECAHHPVFNTFIHTHTHSVLIILLYWSTFIRLEYKSVGLMFTSSAWTSYMKRKSGKQITNLQNLK